MKPVRALFLALILVLLVVSCDSNTADPVGWVRIGMSGEKNLMTDVDSSVAYFEYCSEAMFIVDSPHPLRGETRTSSGVLSWKKVSCTDGVSDLIGPFSQGRWRIQIHACNAAGSILYTDVQEVWITIGQSAYIHFNATRGYDEGAVSIDFTTTKTTASNGVTVRFEIGGTVALTKSSGWTVTDDGNKVRYQGSVTLPAGSYIAYFTLANAGEVIAVEVLSGETTHITGTIIPGQFADQTLTIVTPDETRAHISASSHTMGFGSTMRLTLVRDSGTFTASDVKWYVNGTLAASSGMTYDFTPSSPGLYDIVAVIYLGKTDTQLANGASTASVYYETSSSATWNVTVSETLTSVTISSRDQIIDVDWESESVKVSNAVQRTGYSNLGFGSADGGVKVSGYSGNGRFVSFWIRQTVGQTYRVYRTSSTFGNTSGGFSVIRVYETASQPTVSGLYEGTALNQNATSYSWTATKAYAQVTVELTGDTTVTDLHLRQVKPIYSSAGSEISLPYTAQVPQIHEDGRYTLNELGLHQR